MFPSRRGIGRLASGIRPKTCVENGKNGVPGLTLRPVGVAKRFCEPLARSEIIDFWRTRLRTEPFACIAKGFRACAHVRAERGRMRRARKLAVALTLPVVLALSFAPGALATGPPGSYTTPVFSDGFESGSLIGWDGLLGNGSATVIPGAAHTGTFGLEMSNGAQQFQVAVKSFPSTYADSSTSFWVRFAAGSGFQMVAQARDSTSSAHMWD